MKKDNSPQADSGNFELPSGFFDAQFKAITQKTTDLENWQIDGTRSIESCFPVPSGYWLAMEDGVRARINPSRIETKVFPIASLKWALVAASVVLLMFSGIWMWTWQENADIENWQAKIQQIPQDELLAYIGDVQRDEREYLELYALTSLGENGLPVIEKSEVEKKTLEESLEEYNTSDLMEELDIE